MRQQRGREQRRAQGGSCEPSGSPVFKLDLSPFAPPETPVAPPVPASNSRSTVDIEAWLARVPAAQVFGAMRRHSPQGRSLSPATSSLFDDERPSVPWGQLGPDAGPEPWPSHHAPSDRPKVRRLSAAPDFLTVTALFDHLKTSGQEATRPSAPLREDTPEPTSDRSLSPQPAWTARKHTVRRTFALATFWPQSSPCGSHSGHRRVHSGDSTNNTRETPDSLSECQFRLEL